MPNPWDAQIVVSPAHAQSLIESQFPDLAPARVEPFGVGWDNTAYLVNDELVFRFPRREIAVPLLETEARVLPHLAARLPLPVPNPEWVGRADETYPWPFVGYRRLPGHSASNVPLDDAQCRALARPLGEFLKALHAVPVADAERWGAEPDTFARLDGERLGELVRPALAGLVSRGAIEDERPWLAVLDRGAAAPLSPRLALVHGDLYSRHLLVDDGGRATGVIDFGDLHVGQPAVDLGIAWSLLPPAARPAFFQAYGPVDADVVAKARLRALTSAVMQESYGRDVGDRALEEAGLRALRCVVAEEPGGTIGVRP